MQEVKKTVQTYLTAAVTALALVVLSISSAGAQSKSISRESFRVIGVHIDTRGYGRSSAIFEDSATRSQVIFDEGESLGAGYRIAKISNEQVVVKGPGSLTFKLPVEQGAPAFNMQAFRAIFEAPTPTVKPNRVVEFDSLVRGFESPERLIGGVRELAAAGAAGPSLTVTSNSLEDSIPNLFGLLPGDKITAVNTIPVTTLRDLINGIIQVRGDYITLVYKRGAATRRVILKPAAPVA